MTIGNRENAEKALTFTRSYLEFPGRADFEMVGVGSRRKVVLHVPSQVVYKIDILWQGEADAWSNVSEIQACDRLAGIHQHPDIPFDVEIPEVTAYDFSRADGSGIDTVVAMAYYGDDHPTPFRIDGYIRDVFYNSGWSDLFHANWRWFDDHLVIIDCGSFGADATPLHLRPAVRETANV